MSDRPLRDEDLVRVRSHSELRDGMAVVLRACDKHGRTCSVVLLRVFAYAHDRHSDKSPCDLGLCWVTTHDQEPECYGDDILDGRLYRLRSSDGKEREEGAGLGRKAQFYQSALKLRREGAL